LARNHQIRGALEGIATIGSPGENQQSIRVIRKKWIGLSGVEEILPR